MKPVIQVEAPIGVNEHGQPIEEVTTTATRLRSSMPWSAIALGVLAGLVVRSLQRPRRRRRR